MGIHGVHRSDSQPRVYTLLMRISSPRLRFVARLLLFALLSGQGVLAAQACFAEVHRPAMAYSGGHCGTPEQGHANPNTCLTQCLQSDQSSSGYHVEVPGPVLIAFVVLPTTRVCPPIPLRHSVLAVPETGPPPPIRFCSFLL